MENPDASPEELAQKIQSALYGGELVVIDRNGELVRSDQEQVGVPVKADDPVMPGGGPVPEGPPSDRPEDSDPEQAHPGTLS